MKKIFVLISLVITLTGCSSTLLSVKDNNITPHQYKKPLFITTGYYSTKSGFAQFFSSKATELNKVSDINKSLLNNLLKRFSSNGIKFSAHIVNINIEEEKKPKLNDNENADDISKKAEILSIINSKNIDILIKIIPTNISTAHYTSPSTGLNGEFSMNSSSNLSFKYTITAIDTKSNKEVWKGTYEVDNANSFLDNTPSVLAKKVHLKLMEDQLF
ncbi:lipoprotein [Wenyingzhuangia marina]|uniref:Type IV secretion system putative lipoprotein virB7 n=1 Tax=Wenyingzhuangia marina TaxID=1195760 RepID=A0A1M5WPM1_9FLAO|nr:lipoprotein [Wenyingzhuangia marina]GGF79784.1 hypothetical protein GCM10011397_23540 [Wenyingzhuangia marina]SHH89458.1 hypothetical protein SAMN05444281_2563 [Wenyingzhuangia marina]